MSLPDGYSRALITTVLFLRQLFNDRGYADHEKYTEITMKKLIGLVVIITVLILGSYYGMGLLTERTIEKNIEVINQSNGLVVEIEAYDRGWYTSTALLNWSLHIPERQTKDASGAITNLPAQDYKVEMPLTVYHGPIIFADKSVKFGLGYAHSNVAMPQMYAEKFSNLFTDASTKPTLDLSLFVNYLNNSRFHVGLPTFKLISKQGGDQFEWYGMDSNVSVSSSMKNIDGGVTIEGASLTKNKMNAVLGKVVSNYDMHQTDAGLYLGNATISLPSFAVTENEQKILTVEQVDVQSSSEIVNSLFNTSFKASLNKLTAHGKTYGPALLEMSIKNLDAQVLAEINAEANKLQQGTDAERQQALLMMLPQLPKLFSKGAQFEISKLSFIVPEGAIKGELLVSLPQGDAGNPFQLLQKVEGHGTLAVPASVLKSLVRASLRQKLLSEPNLQQAMAQQIKTTDLAQAQATAPAGTETPAPVDKTTPAPAAASNTPSNPEQASADQKPLTVAEVEQQATTQADQKLATMVQVGLLSLQGNEYVIEINLAQGQLTVNGNPFSPAMMQF